MRSWEERGLPSPGTVLKGRYRLDEPVGRGGMAVVFRASCVDGGHVAVKLLPERLRIPAAHRRFLREYTLAQKIHHPNVVQTRDGGIYAGTTPFLVMEWLEGETLADRLLRDGRMPLAETVRTMVEVLAGIGAAHSSHVVHRDLKPSNVFSLRSSGVKLIDFGLSKDIYGGGEPLTDPREALGTPSYMAPEQILGHDVDERTDVYGAGALFYELLSGERAFPGPSEHPEHVFAEILEVDPSPPSAERPEVPPGADAIVLRALAKRPADRFSSAEDMRLACMALAAKMP